jgi:hypothetical protein
MARQQSTYKEIMKAESNVAKFGTIGHSFDPTLPPLELHPPKWP